MFGGKIQPKSQVEGPLRQLALDGPGIMDACHYSCQSFFLEGTYRPQSLKKWAFTSLKRWCTGDRSLLGTRHLNNFTKVNA